MDLFWGAALGLMQGVTEFLPISSSGHLALAELLLGSGGHGTAMAAMEGNAFFHVMLHLATLAAVAAAYRDDILAMAEACGGMLRAPFRRDGSSGRNAPARRLLRMLLFATLPLAAVVPLRHALESLSGVPWFIGAALLTTGVLLYAADRMPRGTKTQEEMSVTDALVMGLAQAAAVLPGLSRSGSAVTAGMSRGLDRGFAVKFSFLMSLLSVTGAAAVSVIDVLGDGVDAALLPACAAGMAAAGLSGYLCIRLLQRIVTRGRFGGFACYCWGMGALSIVLWLLFK